MALILKNSERMHSACCEIIRTFEKRPDLNICSHRINKASRAGGQFAANCASGHTVVVEPQGTAAKLFALHAVAIFMYPRRYYSEDGKYSLIGLTLAETLEFERLEEQAPTFPDGSMAWEFEGVPISADEKRWLDLYERHESAYQTQRD